MLIKKCSLILLLHVPTYGDLDHFVEGKSLMTNTPPTGGSTGDLKKTSFINL